MPGRSSCPGARGSRIWAEIRGKWKKFVELVEGKVEMDGGKARST